MAVAAASCGMSTNIRALGWAATAIAVLVPGIASSGRAPCPPDSVQVGPVCVDKYEASVWQIPPTSRSLLRKVLDGRARLDDLTRGAAVLIGCALVPDAKANYPDNFP